MRGTPPFGDVLADILRRRYIAPIDVAREVGVAPGLVERWLRGDALPRREDVTTLAALLDGADARRLRLATGRLWSDGAPPETARPLGASERAAVTRLPAPYRGAFATAFGRSDGGTPER